MSSNEGNLRHPSFGTFGKEVTMGSGCLVGYDVNLVIPTVTNLRCSSSRQPGQCGERNVGPLTGLNLQHQAVSSR